MGTEQEASAGIWIPGEEMNDETGEESEPDDRHKHVEDGEDGAAVEGDDDDDTDISIEDVTVRGVGTRFSVLKFDDVDEDDDENVTM
jgi:hypothetical protein